MSQTPAQAQAEMMAVGPQGDAMPVNGQPGAVYPQLFAPLADAVSSFQTLALEMLVEVNPGEAVNLLPDYIRVLGPDPYGRDAEPLSQAEEQQLCLQRWTARGGASIGYFEQCAAALGLSITIQEQTVLECGYGVCGDNLSRSPQEFYWLVVMPAASEGTFAGDAVQTQITIDAPAHTVPVFSYTG